MTIGSYTTGPIVFDCWIRIEVRSNWTFMTGTDLCVQLRNATAVFFFLVALGKLALILLCPVPPSLVLEGVLRPLSAFASLYIWSDSETALWVFMTFAIGEFYL